MVGERQIIVNSLGASHKADLRTGDDSVIGKLLDGVHGIVAADIDKAVNLQIRQDLEDFFIDLPAVVDVRKLVAAGTQISTGGAL